MTLRIFLDGGRGTIGGHVVGWVRPDGEGEDVRLRLRVGAEPAVVDVPPGRYLVEVLLPSGERLRAPASVGAGTSDVRLAVPGAEERLAAKQALQLKRRLIRSSALERLDVVAPAAPSVWLLARWPAEWAGVGLGRVVKAGERVALQQAVRVERANSEGPILRYVLSPSGAPDALGAAVVAFEGSSAIVPVARSWQSLSGGQAATELVVDAERKCVEPGIDDPEFAPVLGYLARGDRGLAAESLGDLPLELLMDKMVNPFAAAAGAYVLVEALDDTSRAPRWRGWIENLATRFTWLPDGAILEGRALLATESPGAALDRFLQGFERGVPLFAEGVRMLLDGLLAFSPDDAAPTDGARLRAATDHVRHWSAWLDPRQCFTTLRVPLAVEEAMPHGAGA